MSRDPQITQKIFVWIEDPDSFKFLYYIIKYVKLKKQKDF